MATRVKAPAGSQTRIGITEARAQLGELVDRVRYRGTPIILEKMGKPVAALVSIEELARLQRIRWEETKVFDQTAAEIAKSGLTEEELDNLINEAIQWARAKPK